MILSPRSTRKKERTEEQNTAPEQKAPARSFAVAVDLLNQAAGIRATVAQMAPGAQFHMSGPGGIQRPATVAEVLEHANQVQKQGERMMLEIVTAIATTVAARIATGELEVTRKPEGGLHVAPPGVPEGAQLS